MTTTLVKQGQPNEGDNYIQPTTSLKNCINTIVKDKELNCISQLYLKEAN
jgi:hypothetical protein